MSDLKLAFTVDEYRDRVAKVQELMAREGLDALLVHDFSDICYLTGFESIMGTAKYFMLLIEPEGDPCLVGEAFEFYNAGLTCWVTDFVSSELFEDLVVVSTKVIKQRGLEKKRLGVNSRTRCLSPFEFDSLKQSLNAARWVDASKLVRSVRAIKSPAEIEYTRQAARISDISMKAAVEAAVVGKTDNDLAAASMEACFAAGSEFVCLEPIISLGKRSGVPHCTFSRNVIRQGDLCFIEIGACVHRYTGPIIRTVAFGRPGPIEERVGAEIEASLNATIELLRPGIPASEVARKSQGSWEWTYSNPELFWNGTYGYSIGLGFPPDWSDGDFCIRVEDDTILRPGMVFHCTNNVRRGGVFGLGISDTVVVTETGSEALTQFPRHLVLKKREPIMSLTDDEQPAISAAVDRWNSTVYAVTNWLIYLAAPVTYVGNVQAALFDHLHASAEVANLPASVYLFGSLAPLFTSWAIPARFEQKTVVICHSLMAILMGLVGGVLILPCSDGVRIAAVLAQSLAQGILNSIVHIYLLQCVNRGTTDWGRSRAFKLAFGVGPVAAVAGSLGAQVVLDYRTAGIPETAGISESARFGILYLLGALAMAAIAVLTRTFWVPDFLAKRREEFWSFMRETARSLVRSRSMTLLFSAYVFWNCALFVMPNLTLYSKYVLQRDPSDFVGLSMALRFGCKALTGFVLAAIALRWSPRATLVSVIALIGIGILWAAVVPGYPYLFCFGLMGAGELGGAYFPYYVAAVFPVATGTRDQSLLSLASPVASMAPALHGFLTDHFGFGASFAFAGLSALLALMLVLRLPPGDSKRTPVPEETAATQERTS